ncbi:AMP-binding protein [Actinokineospora iranica]|uniref:Fatty-acyl-CoA synthase n=1 Tax=Actinokineospora iranica TaxID=1271860 RepID=A0A1G6S9D6_9PSEU|nr:AMP-binding protein [Actinokineospora iranica]SDD13281.1 fatty-acyl-CoA synthase [Actinokineospora iranica]
MDDNLATLLEAVADEAGDRVAVAHGDLTRTWRALDDRAARLAGWFAAQGLGRGARIAVALHNGPEYVETVLAAMKLRATAVNVNHRYQDRELVDLLTRSGAGALVHDAALAEKVTGVRDRLPPMPMLAAGADYEAALSATPPAHRVERSGEDEWLTFTGGTTGAPKGVLTTHRWLLEVVADNGYRPRGVAMPADLSELRATTRALLDGPPEVTLVAPPLMHATGLYTTLGCLLAAGTVVFLPSRSFDPDELAERIGRHRVTTVCLVGDAFSVPLADALDRAAEHGRPYTVDSVRRIMSAGVMWSAETKKRLLEHFDAELEDLVAASEGGPFARSVTTRGDDPVTGRFTLLPGCRVVDEDGRDVPTGQAGSLAAPTRDDIGYLDDPTETARAFRVIDGVRHVVPGDEATVEPGDAVTLRGRSSRIINTGGEKVFAEEVEQAVGGHPDVEDVNVIGAPDPRWGHRVVAVIAPRSGAEPTVESVRSHVRGDLADHKCPRQVVLVEKIKHGPGGKPDLDWLREVAQRQADSGGS